MKFTIINMKGSIVPALVLGTPFCLS